MFILLLLQAEETIEVFDRRIEKNKIFKISLKKVSVLDLSWLTNDYMEGYENDIKHKCVQALDIILRHGPGYQYLTVSY